jgi:hypothetical protein
LWDNGEEGEEKDGSREDSDYMRMTTMVEMEMVELIWRGLAQKTLGKCIHH